MNKLIILDRDGILNKLLIDSFGNQDSPMHPNHIEIFPWVPKILKQLCDMEYGLVVATNQPAHAKGKVSFETLNDVHNKIIKLAESNGAKILSSHICFHRAEDFCNCRKPKTGLIQQVFKRHPYFIKSKSWMVGDRATDIIAGSSFGLQTAWLGDPILNDTQLLKQSNIQPSYRGNDLRDFMKMLSR
jgi:D-glycero-D-manno-heptose 1,7-bisphosphate phosphatase